MYGPTYVGPPNASLEELEDLLGRQSDELDLFDGLLVPPERERLPSWLPPFGARPYAASEPNLKPRRLVLVEERIDVINERVAPLTGVAFLELDAATQDILWDHVAETGKQLARFLLRRSALREIGIDGAIGLAHANRLALYAPGELVYPEGVVQDSTSSIFVVQEGEIVLRVRGAIETDFAALSPGEVFGGLPMLGDAPHHETALARTRVRLIEIDERAYPI